MPTMIRAGQLKGGCVKEGVSPEEYERWIVESYAPAAKALPSVEDWRDYRVAGLLGSVAHPPYQYVVTLEIKDPKQLRQNIASQEMQRHFYQLYRSAQITQLISDRFA